MDILEFHAFGDFLPADVQYLVVGTFPGRQFTQRTAAENEADPLAFSYGGRNQFWKILATIYDIKLETRADKQALLTTYQIGMSDLIRACRRRQSSNLDSDLTDIVWNRENLAQIIANNDLKTVFCTGKAVAKQFSAWFPAVACVALPSPSPAFASMSFSEKVAVYRAVFPPKKP
ncbi:MAG: hypothetical protein RL757_264 [Bacteroidota bacterium]|jgi:hypoxanthine-DNA glycosylase